MSRVSESDKRSVDCPRCSARPGKACRGSRIPSPNSFFGGWGGPPDLDRAHAERRTAFLAKRAHRSCTLVRTALLKHSLLNVATGVEEPVSQEWRTEACGRPLFTDAERSSGKCASCASGWTHPENYPAKDGAS